ncbi:dynamin family protein [Candidatus Arthromitus sp. SFB-rat-Yit]|uniref:dynamin family protein n=1 Tax=Candidatus Arthromitus sp. SFB-rat-Yit TaxID=1041504 RepID=UPI0002FAA68D|nr:dynamin family protein [Candidatus Arthromitus sp. SFB-rat-Yit]
MYIDKYQKAISLIDDISLELSSNKELIDNDEFGTSLNNIKYILTQKTFKVAVVGAIKSGKSTMLNAFIGRDLLPNQNAPCTVSSIEIFHSNECCNYVKKQFKDGSSENIISNKGFSLEQMFHNDIKNVRKNNTHFNIEKYLVHTPISGIEGSKYGDVIKKFILLDTPGLDEISTSNFNTEHVKKISFKELRDSDALIIVLDYQNFMSDINGKILKLISSNEKLIERDKNKIFFIINKIDLLNSKDESIDDCIEKARNMIMEYIPAIKNPNINYISARQALLARIVKNNFASKEILDEIDKFYGSKYTESIEINGCLRQFKLEPHEYCDKLLKESRIEIVEDEILNCIFSTFAEESLEVGIEKIIELNNDIINSIDNDIALINNKYNISFAKIENVKRRLHNLKKEFIEVINIPKISLNILKDSINDKLDEMSQYLDNIVNEMLPVKNILEFDNKDDLLYKINVIENNIKESLNVTLNKVNDHIYNEFFNTQIEINKNLNEAFRKIGDEFNKYVNEHIKFKFQIYNFDDICMSNIDFNELNIMETQSKVKECDEFNTSTFSLGMAATSVAGSAVGGILGKNLSVLETAIGATFGAGIGLLYFYIKKLKSTRIREKIIYSVDITEFKDNFLGKIKEAFENIKEEIFKNVNELIKNSVLSVEKQLSKYIRKLDKKIGRFIRNMKINKEKRKFEVKNIELFKKKFIEFRKDLNNIKFKTIHIGEKSIEFNPDYPVELKSNNILVV